MQTAILIFKYFYTVFTDSVLLDHTTGTDIFINRQNWQIKVNSFIVY